MKGFIGTGVALVTPFFEDKSIDFNSLTKIINFQIENKVDYLVCLGSTAEAATLTKDEKEAIRRHVVEVVDTRVPLVVGVGGNDTAAILKELNETDFTGFDAILSVSPAYNKPSQEGIYQHFKAISEHSPLPVILYNVPSRTGSNVLPETVLKLANDFKNIIGIKEAAGSMPQILKLIQHKPEAFLIISGDDLLALPLTLAGGAGVISVMAQALPKDFSEMIQLGLQAKPKQAFDLHYKMMDAIDLIFREGNPIGIKAMLHLLGYGEKYVRLPLVAATEELTENLNRFINNY